LFGVLGLVRVAVAGDSLGGHDGGQAGAAGGGSPRALGRAIRA